VIGSFWSKTNAINIIATDNSIGINRRLIYWP